MSALPADLSLPALDYSQPTYGHDELFTRQGEARPAWHYLLPALAALGPTALRQRQDAIRREFHLNGVSSPVGDADRPRPWALDPIPLPLHSEDWQQLERGLMQRAELLSLVLADLYGPRALIRSGLIPAELVLSHPSYLRPLHGAFDRHESRQHDLPLPLYAADVVRDEQGQWRVIADHSQGLTGVGFALENRVVLSRVMPSLFRDAQVHRLAAFFRSLRQLLMQMAWRHSPDVRIVMLTPGPHSPAYFEHGYLAKYLGYTLVEGADLMSRDGRIALKTLDGLQPVDVILRLADDCFCDPLELRPDGFCGPAGLVQAVRSQQVAVVNPLGSGVLENPAWMAFLPQLAQHFLGQPLHLNSPASYWCGCKSHRDFVLDHLDQLLLRPTTRGDGHAVWGGTLSSHQLRQWRERICHQPYRYVAQELVARATAPVLMHQRLHAAPLTLRSFLIADGRGGYQAMPGALARVSGGPFPAAARGLSKDVWVLASEPERHLTLVPSVDQGPFYAMERGELPSRVAENLFWLGRYTERAEGTLRLLRTVMSDLVESDGRETYASCRRALLQAVTRVTDSRPGFFNPHTVADQELRTLTIDRRRLGSLAAIFNGLSYTMRSVRDRISPDVWRVFSELEDQFNALYSHPHMALSDLVEELHRALTRFAAFTGLMQDSMVHGQGWHFLMIGRRLERAVYLIELFDELLTPLRPDDAFLLEQLLKITDSLMAYRRRFRTQPHIQGFLVLLIHDETNPRALAYQLAELFNAIQQLPLQNNDAPFSASERRLALEALARIRLVSSNELATSDANQRTRLAELLSHLKKLMPLLSDAITGSYFSHADQPQLLVRYRKEQAL